MNNVPIIAANRPNGTDKVHHPNIQPEIPKPKHIHAAISKSVPVIWNFSETPINASMAMEAITTLENAVLLLVLNCILFPLDSERDFNRGLLILCIGVHLGFDSSCFFVRPSLMRQARPNSPNRVIMVPIPTTAQGTDIFMVAPQFGPYP
jgi:hypothetical protein